MAESIVSSFIGETTHGVVVFLLSWIRKEVKTMSKLPEEIKSIKRDLKFIKSWFEGRRRDSDELKVLILEIRDAAHGAEEVLDEFSYIVSKSPEALNIGSMRLSSWSVAGVREMRHIAARAEAVLSSLEKFKTNLHSPGTGQWLPSLRYDVPIISPSTLQPPRIGDRPHVGFDSEMEQLVELLLRGGRGREVVGVVGMGGIGKSTLVSKAYQQVRSQFESSAWVVVSQSYKSFGTIKRSISSQISHVGSSGGAALHDQLRGKRYLIVLDDVWDARVWYALNSELPNDGQSGSRVVVTTRSEQVVSSLGEQRQSLKLKPLSSDHAWELFHKVAFDGIRDCPQDLKPLGEAIVSRCGGLPLGIVTMARLVASREQSAREWEHVEEKLGWYLSTQETCEEVKRVVLLSFDQLPYYLKHCFLYMSIFPEDFTVKKNKLIRLWIAEGFVEDNRVWSPEEQAEEYLKDLVNMNLVEVSAKSPTATNSSSFCYKMHGIIRELAEWIAQQEKFLLVHRGQGQPRHARRLSIQTRGEATLSCQGHAHLHTIVNFDTSLGLVLPIKDIWSSSKFLRVLDLDGARIDKCPDGVDELFNLRYLSLRRTDTSELPRHFRKLPNLITLDLRDTKVNRLHFGIIRSSILHCAANPYLHRLRHFYVGSSSLSSHDQVSPGIPAPDGVCHSANLQKLTFIKADACFVSHVGKLTQLKKLGITDVEEEHWKDLCASIKNMTSLRHLCVAAAPGKPLMVESLFSGAVSSTLPIHKLLLVGPLRDPKLHPWIGLFKSLTHLRLVDSGLSEDPNPMPALVELESLEEIELRNAYLGTVLCFPGESFARLRKLLLMDLPNLKEIVVNKGALPSIEEMHFVNCKQMKESTPLHDREYGRHYNISRRNYDIYAADMMPELARWPSEEANQHL